MGTCELWNQKLVPAPPVDLLLQNRFSALAGDEGRDEWRCAQGWMIKQPRAYGSVLTGRTT